jgi:hypothetical protein
MARVKVVDGWPGYGRLLVLFTGTALLTSLSIGIREPLSRTQVAVVPGFGTVSYTIYIAEAVLSLVIFLAVMVWLSLSEQRVRRSALEGLVFGSGIAVVICAWERWQNGHSLAYILLMAVAIVGTWVVVRLAVLWVVRLLVRQVVLQTGSLCRSCGYDLTGNVSGLCPECGAAVPRQAVPTTPASRRTRPVRNSTPG